MKTIRKTTQFKKDFKKIRHDVEKVRALLEVVRLLELEKEIPIDRKPHRLIGDFNDYMECHIEDDLLLIWFDRRKDIIELVRLGSHSDLFGKGKKR